MCAHRRKAVHAAALREAGVSWFLMKNAIELGILHLTTTVSVKAVEHSVHILLRLPETKRTHRLAKLELVDSARIVCIPHPKQVDDAGAVECKRGPEPLLDAALLFLIHFRGLP